MIQLNHPYRPNVKPLSNTELMAFCNLINRYFGYGEEPYIEDLDLSQSLISSYQNLQHFWDVSGGWDGLNKLQAMSESHKYFTSDINVEYEIVKGE